MNNYSHYRKDIRPPVFASRFYAFKELVRIYTDRLRVHLVRLQGGKGIHPKCLFGKGVKIERPWNVFMGMRCVLQPLVWLNVGGDSANLYIGDFTFIGRGTEIEVSTQVNIGKGCLIAPSVFITDHNHDTRLGAPMYTMPCLSSPVVIGDDVWIGTNAVVLPGVKIGSGSVIGAGAVVTQEISVNTIAAGIPARPIAERKNFSSQ